jgi:hypothetical protein
LGERGSEKIIGFTALGLGAGKAATLTNCGENLELFAQLGIEVTPILVISESVMPTGRSLERIPSNKNGARAFVSVEAQQKTRKSDDSPPTPGSKPTTTSLKTGSAALPSENATGPVTELRSPASVTMPLSSTVFVSSAMNRGTPSVRSTI